MIYRIRHIDTENRHIDLWTYIIIKILTHGNIDTWTYDAWIYRHMEIYTHGHMTHGYIDK